jgi:drug/metabolite transporter (DMT)-like permease
LSWADSAILAAAILAAVNVIDSHLIARRLPSLWAFLFPVGIIAIVYGILTLSLSPLPDDVGMAPVLIAIASSCIRALGVVSFLYAMQKEEVSRIIPVVNIHPVFVAIMAVPLLGEELLWLEWCAIFITVAGAVIISSRGNPASFRAGINRSVALPFLAALCLAGANLTSKYALEDISFWNMYAIGAVVWGIVAVGVSSRSSTLKELRELNRPVSTMAILIINETLAPVAIILLFWSIERGPVSLVSTIAGTQPVFVFIFAMIISRVSAGALLEKRIGMKDMALKFVSIAMIVGGVTIIHLI